MKRQQLHNYLIISILWIFCTLSVGAQENHYFSLDSCRNLAIERNAALKNADLRIRMAEETKRAAFTKYFPNVSATAAAFHVDKPLVDVDVATNDLNITFENARLNELFQRLLSTFGEWIPAATVNAQMVEHGVVTGVTAIQPLFVGGQIVNGNRLAKLGIAAEQAQQQLTKKQILLETEQLYYLVLSLQEKLKTIQLVDNLLDTLHKDVSAAVENGIILENNLLKVKLKQNEMRSNRLKVENGILLAKMALCQHIGVDFSPQFELKDTAVLVSAPWTFEGDISRNVAQRDEAKLLNISVLAEDLKTKMEVGKTLPQLAFGGGFLFNTLLDKRASHWLLFATLKVPITDWWGAAHDIRKQRLSAQIAENNRTDLMQKLHLQMQQQWNSVVENWQQVLLGEEAMREAEKNLTVSTDYYQSGVVALSELLEAQTLMQQSRDQYVDFCIAYKLALQEYYLNSAFTSSEESWR